MTRAGFSIMVACGLALTAAPALGATCPPADPACEMIRDAGSSANRLDLVFMGDGFTEAEKGAFFAAARQVGETLLASETYGDYASLFNVYALFTPSNQSGADDPSEGLAVDTAFDATYDAFGIDRLLTVNTGRVLNEVVGRLPEYNQVIVIVNATQYGGSGGSPTVISLAPQALELARHEMAHTLSNLADEYETPYPGFPDGDPEPNVALLANISPPKWSLWLEPGVDLPTPISAMTGVHSPVGAYEGARFKSVGVFRPTPNCLMRELGITFCQVCAEAMALRMLEYAELLSDPLPSAPASTPSNVAVSFSATAPALEHLKFSWTVDGVALTGVDNKPSLELIPQDHAIAEGAHTLELVAFDETPLIRNDPMNVRTATLTWQFTVTAAEQMPTAVTNTATTTSTTGNGSGGGDGDGDGGGGTTSKGTDCTCSLGAKTAEGGSQAWLPLLAAAFALARSRRRH